jgi:CPA1 family monovalent cation:H+ antiporter
VFVLIGLQLPYVLQRIRDYDLHTLILYGAVFSGFLIVLRLIWAFPGAHMSYLIRRRIFHQKEPSPTPRQIFVVGWTGMRGVISLAAAIAVPQVLANGETFGQRNMIIFLTFSVILVTLVLQGLTLPPLIRMLGLAAVSSRNDEEQEARKIMLESALAHLEQISGGAAAAQDEIYSELERHYQRQLSALEHDDGRLQDGTGTDSSASFAAVARELLRVQRQAAVQLRNQRRIGDELLRELEHELDLGELKFQGKSQ